MQLTLSIPKDNIEMYEDNSCTHLPGYSLPSFFCFYTTKQNEYKFHAHIALVSTINLTVTSFYILISLIN